MIGRPQYLPDDFTSWWEVRLSHDPDGMTYEVVRAPAGHRYARFVMEADADAFARAKNEVLMAGGAN